MIPKYSPQLRHFVKYERFLRVKYVHTGILDRLEGDNVDLQLHRYIFSVNSNYNVHCTVVHCEAM